MIEFNFETSVVLSDENLLRNWITDCIRQQGYKLGELNYIFCDDAYLHKLNVEFLQHDTLTDIISFDDTMGKTVGGDVFISVERVRENAVTFKVSFEEELHRVMIHGILHFMGFNDKTQKEKDEMRAMENECLNILKH